MNVTGPFRRCARAFTLVELLLALTLAGFVGSAALLILVAAISATGAQGDSRRSTVARQLLAERCGGLVRATKGIAYAGPEGMLMWIADRNNNGLAELSELRLLRWSPQTMTLGVYEASPTSMPSPDPTFTLDTDSASAASAASNLLSRRVVLQHVTRLDVFLDTPRPRLAQRARMAISVNTERGIDNSTIIVSPRVE